MACPFELDLARQKTSDQRQLINCGNVPRRPCQIRVSLNTVRDMKSIRSLFLDHPVSLLGVALLLVMGHSVGVVLADAGGVSVVPITFETGNGWSYDGRIELPPVEKRRPWAVMLIGGGMGTDIDWSVPGIMTIDGRETRDAATIAAALLERGFVVMRWNAIRRGDPLHAKDPLMMDPGSFEQTIEQTHKAWAAFRAKRVVPDDHIFLVGHSLGAHRAAAIVAVDSNVPGVVMLAGAKQIPADLDAVRTIVADAGHGHDRNATKAGKRRSRHEHVIGVLTERRASWEKPVAGEKTKFGTPWPADVWATHQTPLLSLVGDVDERWLLETYLLAGYLRRSGHRAFDFVVYDGLGHQLAREVAGDVHHDEYGVIAKSRTGPIESRVVHRLVRWIEHRAQP